MTLPTSPPTGATVAEPEVSRRGGISVHMIGVVHLYRQRGADVVGLRGVDLDIEPGETVALLGPSGMGKTTVLRLMAGIMTASAGIVRVGERNLGGMRAADRRRLRAGEISYVVQGTSANILPYATAVENVWFAQHGARRQGVVPPWQPEELLGMFGLSHLRDVRLAALPRGLQQQVAVAAGVAAGARLLLADEPTAQLTDAAIEGVIGLLRRVNEAQGTTVVIVTHDRAVAEMFPRTVTIRDGRVGSEGRHGQEYAVVDSSGSVQLPPDVLELLPPNTMVRVQRTPEGVELKAPGPT